MGEEQKENQPSNGIASFMDHDEFQYLKLIKNIIETGKSEQINSFVCRLQTSMLMIFSQERSVPTALVLGLCRFLVLRCDSAYAMTLSRC